LVALLPVAADAGDVWRCHPVAARLHLQPGEPSWNANGPPTTP